MELIIRFSALMMTSQVLIIKYKSNRLNDLPPGDAAVGRRFAGGETEITVSRSESTLAHDGFMKHTRPLTCCWVSGWIGLDQAGVTAEPIPLLQVCCSSSAPLTQRTCFHHSQLKNKKHKKINNWKNLISFYKILWAELLPGNWNLLTWRQTDRWLYY